MPKRQKPKATRAEPRLRSDAQRNRDEILAAAVLAFTKDAGASLEGIARAAGVGIGTLYRHYPTREALLEAAYRTEIKRLCDAAPELLEKHRPDRALARLFELFIDHMFQKRGMIEALRAMVAAGGTPLNESLALFTAAVTPLVEAGKAEGVLRDDVTIDDVLSVKGAVVNARPENVRRLAVILLDGLRHGGRAPTARGRAHQAAGPRPKRLLAGGNPRIPKADGDAPVQAYIARMPGWKRDLGKRLDALVVRSVPSVRKAVKWNSPLYGIEGQGWFLGLHTFTRYVKVAFFRGAALRPVPPGESKGKDTRYLDIHEGDELDEKQLGRWVKQAAALPGWVPSRKS